MILVILTAVLAVSDAAKLDRTYLPPITAKTADGSTAALRAPAEGLPSGSYLNDEQGVVVDAASPNTRTSGTEPTGLGGPRTSYGSTASKVGDAAFRGSSNGVGSSGGANTPIAPGFGSVGGVDENAGGPSIRIAPGFSSVVASEGSDYDKSRASTLKFANEVGLDKYSYGFETDNGIAIGENGVAGDGINANGGYSYKGDDGKVYSVSYTADKDGYKPQGSHLPTPPPIPAEILVSLEQNAKDEAAGLVDDGSYDAQKYNDEGDYSSNTDNYNNNGPSVSADATASGSFGQRNQVNKPFDPFHVPGSGNIHAAEHGSPGFGSHTFGRPQFGAQAVGPQGPIQGTIYPAPVPQNGFGVQSEKSDGSESSASAIASTGTNNFDSQNIAGFRLPSSSNGNSAYSSAVTTGSGSASAFASTSPLGSGFKNEYLPPYFGSAGKQSSQLGSDSSAVVTAPDSETVNSDSSSSTLASAPGQNAAVQTVVSGAPFDVGGLNSDKVPSGYSGLNNDGFYKPFNSFSTPSFPSPTQPSHQITQIGSNYASNPSKPALSQQQGSDSSYYYNQPSQVFQTATFSSGKYPSSNRQPNIPVSSSQEFKYSHTLNGGFVDPTSSSSQPGQYQSKTGTSYYNGITQASISPFPSLSTTPSTQFGSQSSQFGSKPAIFGRKPIVQSQLEYSQQSSSQTDHSQSSVQQGTIYEYNKPTKAITSEFLIPNKTNFHSSAGEKPIVNQGTSSSVDPQYGQKPATTQGINIGSEDQTQTSQLSPTSSVQTQSGSKQISQKPVSSLVDFEFQQTQFGFSAGSKPSTQTGSNSQQGQFGSSVNQPTNSESLQFNQGTLYEYNKPAETLSSNKESSSTLSQSQIGLGSNFSLGSETSQASATLLSQSQSEQTQFSQKPFGSSQIGSTYQQTQDSSEFGQKPQAMGIISTTISPDQSISQVNPNPFGSQTAQGSQQTQFGSTVETIFGQKPQSVQGSTFTSNSVTSAQASQIGEKPNKQTDSITFPSRVGEKPSHVFFTSGSFSQNQASKFGQKPLGSSQTQFGSTSQFSSSSSQLDQKQQSTQGAAHTPISSFGQKPFDSSSTGSQYGQKPLGSSFTSSAASKGQSVQTQLGQKPFGLQTAFGSTTGSKFDQSGSSTGSQVSQKQPITSSFGQKPFSTSQSSSSSSQTSFGSTTGSRFGQQSLTNQGSAFTSSSASKGQSAQTQFGKKHFGSTQSQFGSMSPFNSSTGSQIGQKQETTSSFGQKPVSGAQTGSTVSQTTFGSLAGSKFSKKPHTSQGASTAFSSSSQFGSSTGSQIDQKQETKPSFGQKPFGSLQSTPSFSQTTFGSLTGSRFGQKSPTTQDSAFTSNTASKGQSAQTQFGQKPFGSAQSHFGSTSQFGNAAATASSQLGQKQQSVQNAGHKSGTVSQTTSSFSQKPVGSSQTAAFGSSAGSQFGQKPQTTQGSSFTSNTASKGQSAQTQFGQKPFGSAQSHFGSTSQFGNAAATASSQLGQKQQSVQNAGHKSGTVSQTTSSFSQKPVGSSQTTAFGSSAGSQFGQESQKIQGSSFTSNTASKGQSAQTQFGQKPFGSAQSHFGSTSQFGNAAATASSQLGQKQQSVQNAGHKSGTVSQTTSSFSQKPEGSSQTAAFGSSAGSQFGQKLQTTQGSSFTSNTASKGQSAQTQFGQKPFGSAQSHFGSTSQFGNAAATASSQLGQKQQSVQNAGHKSGTVSQTTSSFSQKPVGSSQTTAFGSSAGSQFGQESQKIQGSSFTSNTASKGQSAQTQFGQKPFGSAQSHFGSTSQFSNAAVTASSQLGQKQQSVQNAGHKSGTVSQTTSSFSQKPVGSSQTAAFGSSAGSQFGQKPQTIQGSSFTSNTASKGQSAQTQFGQKPFGSAQSHFGSTSQFGNAAATASSQLGQKQQSVQNAGHKSGTVSQTTSSFSQKPVGSSQTTAFGSSAGSQFGQKPQTIQGSSFTSNTASKGQSAQTQFGQKPFGSAQSHFGSTSQFGNAAATASTQLGQKQQSVQNAGHKSGTVSQTTSSFSQKPVGSSQTTAFGSSAGSQFGQESQKIQGSSFTSNTASKGQSAQTQFGQKHFGSTQSHFGSTSQLGSAAATAGSQAGQIRQTTSFGQKPFGSSQSTSTSTQTAFGSSLGSQYGQKPQISQGISTNFGSSSQFGSSTGTQVVQKQDTTSSFGQKPFGNLQTSSTFSQTAFGSTTGSQLGHNAQATHGSSFTTKKPFVSSQLGSSTGSNFNQFGSQSQQESLQQTQLGTTANSQFGQTIQTTSAFGKKPTTGSQVGFGTQQTQSSLNSGTVFSQNAQSTQASSLSTSGETNGQNGYTTPTGQKTLTSSQTTGSGLSQAQIGSTSVASTGPQVQSIFDYRKKPVDSLSTQGSLQQSHFGSSAGSQFGQNTVQGQTGQTQSGQQPFGSSQTIGSSFQQTQSGSTFGSQFGKKPLSAFGYLNSQSHKQSSQGTNRADGNTQTPFQTQFSATSDKSLSSATAFASSGSFNSHTDTVEGYNYQKPQNPFKTPSRLGEQPTQAAFGQGYLNNGVHFSTPSTLNSFEQTYSSVGPAQIGGDQNLFSSQNSGQSFSTADTPVSSISSFSNVQPPKPTLGQFDFNKKSSQTQISFEDLKAASKAKYGEKPTLGVIDTSKQLSQNSGAPFNGQPEIGSIHSTGFPTTAGSVSAQDSSNLESAASPVITSITGIKNSFVGAGEHFGGPRTPQRFDEKTGYHY